MNQALFLGTGASLGSPVIGCKCSVCQSDLPQNKRLRSSLLLKMGSKQYLIDVGPDFREQALKHQIEDLDGVIFTHSHYDHIGGLDELRIFYFKDQKPVPCLVSRETLEEIKVRYHYIMPPTDQIKEYKMKFDFQILEGKEGNATFEGLHLDYFSYTQVGMKVMGIKVGSFAYVIDISEFEETLFDQLKGVETLVLDGTTWERTAAHFGIDEAIPFAKKVGAKRTYLTHIAHDVDHQAAEDKLPDGMHLAYDGLKLTF